MYKYFESRLVGGNLAKDDRISILPTATNAAWDDSVKVFRLMEMYKWGDWMPSNSWIYAPNSGKRISDGYQYFLSAAWVAAVSSNGTAPADVKMAALRASEDIVFARNEYNQTINDAQAAYDAYVAATAPGRRKTKAAFYKDQTWDVQIAATKKRLDQAAETYDTIAQSIVDPDIQMLKQAQIRFLNPKQKIWLPPVREFLNDPDRWQQYYVNAIDKDIFAFLRETNSDVEHISESESTSTFFESRWSASVSVSFLGLFRAGGASAEEVKREQHIRNNTTKIDIRFSNIDTFNVVRGEWFDDNVISRFASKLKPDAYNAVFGPNGQLEYMPKTLLVGRGMTFSIYADSDSLDYLYEYFHAGADAGIYIGYWKIGGGGDYSSTKSETKVTKFSDHIDFVDLSGRGKVLALLSKYYAGVVPKPAPLLATFSVKPEELVAARTRLAAEWKAPTGLQKILESMEPEIKEDVVRSN
jgi:hypothetical protein